MIYRSTDDYILYDTVFDTTEIFNATQCEEMILMKNNCEDFRRKFIFL